VAPPGHHGGGRARAYPPQAGEGGAAPEAPAGAASGARATPSSAQVSGSRAPGHSRLRSLVVLSLAILANGAGNLALGYGMKSIGPPRAWTLPGLWDVVGTALSSAPVILGGLLLLVFFALFLSLLSWADLSYVLPMISSCFAVSAILGRFVLGERLSLVRWAGIALVSIGVLLVGRT